MSSEKTDTRYLPLVHKWDGSPQQSSGLFPLSNGLIIPAAWEPSVQQLDPKAIATPFARGETMRLVLERPDRATPHRYVERFRWLLLGVAAGVLHVEADSLASSAYDNLGEALLQVDEEARYFCRLVWPADGRLFGITYRSSLFSPHARRTEAEWAELANAIKLREKAALELLADWRAALQAANRWDRSLKGCIWQQGVDDVLTGHALPANGTLLREHCQLVGPVWLHVPTGSAEQPVRQEPLYLPSYSEGFARRFSRALQFKPEKDSTSGAVVFKDAGNTEVARIDLSGTGTDNSPVALGMGRLRLHDVPVAEPTAVTNWVPELAKLLKPLELELQKVDRPTERVTQCPVLYPDVIRLPVERNLWPVQGRGQEEVSPVLFAVITNLNGRALDDAETTRLGGETVSLGTDAQRVTLRLVDNYAETQVNDLRAIGAALWAAFVGKAEVSAQLQGALVDSNTLQKLFEHSARHPLVATKTLYDRVVQEPQADVRQRLATLQRFVRAYSPVPETAGLERVCARAARSFARWANGGVEVSQQLGRRPAAPLVVKLPTGEDLRLWVDSLVD